MATVIWYSDLLLGGLEQNAAIDNSPFAQYFLLLILTCLHQIKCHIYTFLFFLLRIHSPSDILGKSLAGLQKQFSEILAQSQWEKEEAQVRERKLHEEMVLQQERLANGQEEFRQACERALEARVRKGRDSQRVTFSKCWCFQRVIEHTLVIFTHN